MKTLYVKRSGMVLTLLFIFITLALGQINNRRFEANLSVSLGYANLDNTEFQSFLVPGFEELSKHYASFGASGHVLLKNLLLGVSGQFIGAPTKEHGDLDADVTGGMGFLNVGYALVNKERFKVYPLLGIGGGVMDMKIMHQGDITQGEIINNPMQQTQLSIANAMVDLGAGLDYTIMEMTSADGRTKGGLNLGLRAGYIFGADDDNWTYTGGDVMGGPEFGMRSYYVRLAVGLSGIWLRN